ncbi:hypothetical protein AAF712_004626 [Marasmius tenuissimus]|uniref:Uncharacterized protein n=1 Tax=Marasmius tenuissimus TaxID=585030 RepID=A0ABR3A2M6_9AGAR
MYPMRPAHTGGPERRVKDGSLFVSKDIIPTHTFQNRYDALQERFSEIYEKGRIPLVKEHILLSMSATVINKYFPDLLIDTKAIIVDETCPSCSSTTDVPNPMVLPHSFLANLTPIFTIRHPIRMISSGVGIMFRSYGRGFDEPSIDLTRTYKWSRILYDYYRAIGITPIVIDGDELVRHTEDQMNKLCSLIGLDGSKIQYSWEPKASHATVDERMREEVYLKAVYESTGVIRDEEKLKPPALDEEQKEWAEEWGDEAARKLTVFVEEAMEDYNYLLRASL